MKKIKLIIYVLLVASCIGLLIFRNELVFIYKVNKHYADIELSDKINDKVVLVNIGEGDRFYLAAVIEKLSRCNPAAIGMDFTLLDLKSQVSDDRLKNAIASSKTILSSIPNHNGNGYFDSHQKFTSSAHNSGIAALVTDFDMATSYYPKYVFTESDKNHISVSIADVYDSLATETFERQIIPGKKYAIPYRYLQNQFITYNYGDTLFSCDEINDKIVLMGYLGPKREDVFITPLGGLRDGENYDPAIGDMYGVVIIANQVLGIIDGIEPQKY